MTQLCKLCHNPGKQYGTWHGRPVKTCTDCCERQKARYWKAKEADEPITPASFEEVIRWYQLTVSEADAVDLAARQVIIFRKWKKRNEAKKWPGPTAEAVVNATGKTPKRRAELLCAASLRLREILTDEGIEPRTFFNQHR